MGDPEWDDAAVGGHAQGGFEPLVSAFTRCVGRRRGKGASLAMYQKAASGCVASADPDRARAVAFRDQSPSGQRKERTRWSWRDWRPSGCSPTESQPREPRHGPALAQATR